MKGLAAGGDEARVDQFVEAQSRDDRAAFGGGLEVGPLSTLSTGDEVGVDEHLHVVAECALGELRLGREIADAGAVIAGAGRNVEQQGEARFVAESFELLGALGEGRGCCSGLGEKNRGGGHTFSIYR